MAQIAESFEDCTWPNTFSAQLGELPTLLDHLLLTIPSLSTLYPRLADFLLQVVAVDGVWLGAPDEQEKVQYNFYAGEGVKEFLAGGTIRINDNPHSALARAWRTGIPQFALDWTDSKTPLPDTFWHERGLRFGWRSMCAIPVSRVTGKREVLILYSKRPHFFAEEQIQQFVLYLQSLLSFASEQLRLQEEMEQSQQALALYKTAMDAAANGILIAEAVDDMPICYVNPAFERMTGYSAEEVIGRNCRFLQGADTAQPQMEIICEVVRQGKSCTVELKNYRKNGTMFWNSLSIAPVLNDTGTATHFIGILNDIVHLKSVLNESVHSNALYRALMGTAELVIKAQSERQLLAELCRLLVESKLFAQVWVGRPNTAGELEIQSIFSTADLTSFSYLPNVYTGDEESILAVRAWRRSQMQFTNDRLTDPEYAPIQDYFRRHDLHATAVVPLYRDGKIWALLTLLSRESNIFSPELLELIERIGRLVGHGLDALDLRHILEEERKYQSWLARHDPLTDLLNRRGLIERVEEASARARLQSQSMAVALVDLNGFRVLNELHGYPACDLMLRTVAERLQTSLGQGDAAGRLGGDEFVLVLENIDEQKLAAAISRIQTSVEKPIQLANGRTATIRTSIGVTVFPQDNSSPEHLLRHADRALYALKETGEAAESRWMIFQEKADEQKRLHHKAVLALFRKGNIRVHYQPIINLQTGCAVKVEALARLVDNDNALLFPANFLPPLGHAELAALTSQVLSRGIQDMHRLDQAGFHLNLSINVEPVTLADPKAMQELRHQIESSGMVPGRFVLELLEHPDMLSMAGSSEALSDLKTAGVRIALDDVGSAHSSLLRMKVLPVDTIKLDGNFLIGLERHPHELRFLMNLVDLARALGLRLIAEGIENQASGDALAALGVQYAQGYAIAMPMDIEKLEAWLLQHKPLPWIGPTTPLGAVALQLRDLFMTGRMLDQKPSLLQQLVSFDPDCSCQIGRWIRAIGPEASKLLSIHLGWHTAMAALWEKSGGSVDPLAFQTARAAYEEKMFLAVLKGSSSDS